MRLMTWANGKMEESANYGGKPQSRANIDVGAVARGSGDDVG